MRLIGHRALELERRSPGFQTGECDLFDLPEGPFEVVRAMNILNPGYFEENRLKTALNGIHRALVPGGLLVVGANEEAGSKVEGGVYRRSASGFEFISQADGACRIHSLIMERATGVS